MDLNIKLNNLDSIKKRNDELERILSSREVEFDELDERLKKQAKFCQGLSEEVAKLGGLGGFI